MCLITDGFVAQTSFSLYNYSSLCLPTWLCGNLVLFCKPCKIHGRESYMQTKSILADPKRYHTPNFCLCKFHWGWRSSVSECWTGIILQLNNHERLGCEANICNLRAAGREELRKTAGRQRESKCCFFLCAVHRVAVPVKYWVGRKLPPWKEQRIIEKDESCSC